MHDRTGLLTKPHLLQYMTASKDCKAIDQIITFCLKSGRNIPENNA